jgi:DNA ligase-1
MRRFSDLCEALDGTSSTGAKVEAMAQYFRAAPVEDAAWAVFFLTGQRSKRLISGRTLRAWALRYTELPEWLVGDAQAATGDSAETVTLLVHRGTSAEREPLSLHRWLEERILPLRELADEQQYAQVSAWWRQLPLGELFVLNKLLTGTFRVGVSQPLVVRALGAVSGMPRATIAHRLAGRWQPTATWYQGLLAATRPHDDPSLPYPFFLASPLEQPPHRLGSIDRWLAEWKWDGIRAQLIRRRGEVFLWSRGEELVTGRFPELAHAAARLPDGCVLDGEILAWDERGVLPFAVLQTRIARDMVSARALERAPVSFLAYDVLEQDGQDIRALPLAERLSRLAVVLEGLGGRLLRSRELAAADWRTLEAARAESRERRVEGLMLKRRDSAYGTGRQPGSWWKWKVDPLRVDAVLVYAQAGSGRRANLFTDYTFAVWQNDALVPIAKACSGLSDPETLALDRWIRGHTVERFGPVRQVVPDQGVRARLRGHHPLQPPQIGYRPALSTGRALAYRQDGARGRPAGRCARAAARLHCRRTGLTRR